MTPQRPNSNQQMDAKYLVMLGISTGPPSITTMMMAPVRDTETLCSVDFTDYTWPEDELACLTACMGPPGVGAASRPRCIVARALRQRAAGPAAATTPGIGHNNPPRLEETKFAQQIEAIVNSDYTSPQKLILLKIRLRSDHRTLRGAFPSYATLRRAASVKDDRTVRDARLLVDEDETGRQRGILTRETREGKASPTASPKSTCKRSSRTGSRNNERHDPPHPMYPLHPMRGYPPHPMYPLHPTPPHGMYPNLLSHSEEETVREVQPQLDLPPRTSPPTPSSSAPSMAWWCRCRRCRSGANAFPTSLTSKPH